MTRPVRHLQEAAARALPAEVVERDGGWWLRHAPGCGWWVGTVLPHGDAHAPAALPDRVARAEAFHAEHGTPARFQITPGACQDGLDALLAARGYRPLGPMSLQVAPAVRVAEHAAVGAPPVRLADRPPAAWLDAWLEAHAGEGDVRAQRAMLGRVSRPSAYACALLDGDVVAVGRAVADGDWAGVFDMATHPAARGRGAARAVLAALARWAARRGAGRLYLQVEHANAPALRLYGRAVFTEICAYHYRCAGRAPGSGERPGQRSGSTCVSAG